MVLWSQDYLCVCVHNVGLLHFFYVCLPHIRVGSTWPKCLSTHLFPGRISQMSLHSFQQRVSLYCFAEKVECKEVSCVKWAEMLYICIATIM